MQLTIGSIHWQNKYSVSENYLVVLKSLQQYTEQQAAGTPAEKLQRPWDQPTNPDKLEGRVGWGERRAGESSNSGQEGSG